MPPRLLFCLFSLGSLGRMEGGLCSDCNYVSSSMTLGEPLCVSELESSRRFQFIYPCSDLERQKEAAWQHKACEKNMCLGVLSWCCDKYSEAGRRVYAASLLKGTVHCSGDSKGAEA